MDRLIRLFLRLGSLFQPAAQPVPVPVPARPRRPSRRLEP